MKSDQLLEALTAKATALEKLKAKLGIGSATLSAFVALIDSEIDEEDTALLQVCLANRLHIAVPQFSNRSQLTSKYGKNKKVALEPLYRRVCH